MAQALVVGIPATSYRTLEVEFPHLPGVELDVARMTRFLQARGFTVEVVAPPAADPSAARVKEELEEIVSATESGELSVVYICGHGYRKEDLEGDEADDWDECIVCSDDVIVDDWFREELWAKCPKAGARLVVVADTCHSGTGMVSVLPQSAGTGGRLEAHGEPKPAGYYRLALSTCADNELAGENRVGGYGTSAMLAALEREPTLNYKDLWSRVTAALDDLQVPQTDSLGPDDALLWAPAFTP